MSRRYKGAVISATPPTTSIANAPGEWTLTQQMQAQAAGAWPVGGPFYIEDVFSTYLYTGNGGIQNIVNNVALGSTAPWQTDSFTQGSYTTSQSVASDTSGNYYVISQATASVIYANLAKFNSAGVLQWQRSFSQATACYGYAVNVDSSGNVYISGTLLSTGAFIAKYNSAGAIQWQRTYSVSGTTYFNAIAFDSSNNVYLCGSANSGNRAVFVKYNSSGALQWQRFFAYGTTSGGGVTVDSSANVYFTGNTYDAGLGGQTLFIAKYNSSGILQWQQRLGSNVTGDTQGTTCAVDSTGNVYVTGRSYDPVTTEFILIVKYNSSGTLQWQTTVSSDLGGYGYGIAVDSSSNVYVCGRNRVTGGTINMQVVKLNTSGTLLWQRYLYATNSSTYGTNLSLSTTGQVYVTGYVTNNSTSVTQGFVSVLAQDGSTLSGSAFVTMATSGISLTTPNNTSAAGSATDSAGTGTDSAGASTDGAGGATIQLYTQNSVTGFGGLAWTKCRSVARSHFIVDTARTGAYYISSDSTGAQAGTGTPNFGFTSIGYTLNSALGFNGSGDTYVGWTFRKQPKFFDVVTYTGTGAAQNIAHNLGSVPGCIIIKRTDAVANWAVYHRSAGSPAQNVYLALNTTGGTSTSSTWWNSTAPTSTVFTVGTSANTNFSGGTYVAYVFANDAGGFGPTGTDNVISCGSFVIDGSGNVPTTTLGYEPQWLMIKTTDVAGPWYIFDSMRGFSIKNEAQLSPNTSGAESDLGSVLIPTATGFTAGTSAGAFSVGNTYIYVAVRRGPMKVPTDATTVFQPVTYTGTGSNRTITSSIQYSPDLVHIKLRDSPATDNVWFDKLRGAGQSLITDTLAAEVTQTAGSELYGWLNNGYNLGGNNSNAVNNVGSPFITYMFTRAPNFFDEVYYVGTGANATITHNLGVVPELMIVKSRTGSPTYDWCVYSATTGNTQNTRLNTTAAAVTGATVWNNTTPTSTVFSVGGAGLVNGSGLTYVAYLFATCAGVSKVGSYTGSGVLQTINCGFTGGARFVMIKRTDSTSDWVYFDTSRGMSAGVDPRLAFNTANAETNANWAYTIATGFQLPATSGVNTSGGTYIFLAIA